MIENKRISHSKKLCSSHFKALSFRFYTAALLSQICLAKEGTHMATIQDIADRLGVSKGTVSKAINNAPDISETLRKTVLDTAVEMGYTRLRRQKMMQNVSAS